MFLGKSKSIKWLFYLFIAVISFAFISSDALAAGPSLRQNYGLSGVGASQNYAEVEAENSYTNAEVLGYSTTYISDFQSEASNRRAVKLNNAGDFVELTLPKDADCMVIRYSLPDGNNGQGLDSTLSMYVNGNHNRNIDVTSRYAWQYGEYPYNNNPGSGKGHRFFDDVKVHFGQTYSAGTKIKLQKDGDDYSPYYIIDLVDFENAGGVIPQPYGYLNVEDYGAHPNDNIDDYNALMNCFNDARYQGRGVYLPAGTFNLFEKRSLNVSDVSIQGAGMWHTTLYGAGAAFRFSGNCQFSDFALTGVSTVRDDAGDLAGFEVNDSSYDSLIQNIWIEHTKVGCWFYNSNNITVQGCRIRDTYADGINMCSNVHNSVIQNNSVRNTGDDGIAIWPWQGNSTGNIIRYNNVSCPTLANCIAVYGGGDNQVSNNYLADSICFGVGVNISSAFDTSDGFTGPTTVSYNTLDRCGSFEHNLFYERGSIWIYALNRPIVAGINVYNNSINNSVFSGITIDGYHEIYNTNFTNNYFNGIGHYGVEVRDYAKGNILLDGNHVTGLHDEQIKNFSNEFEVWQSNGGLNVEGGSSSSNNTGDTFGEIYRITSKASGKCLDIEGGKTSEGANVLQWEYNGGANQQWYLNQNSDGSYFIKSVLSGKVIDVEGGSKANGGNILVWNQNNQDNQKWWITPMDNGFSSIVSKSSGKSIDISGGSKSNGGNAIQWDYHGGDNQQWKIELVR